MMSAVIGVQLAVVTRIPSVCPDENATPFVEATTSLWLVVFVPSITHPPASNAVGVPETLTTAVIVPAVLVAFDRRNAPTTYPERGIFISVVDWPHVVVAVGMPNPSVWFDVDVDGFAR